MEKLRKDDAKDNIKKYENQLVLDELSERTIKKYVVDVEQWLNDMPDIINKTSIISYKNNLAKLYKPTTVNSKIISVNKFLKWMGCDELKIKTKRIQTKSCLDNVITREYYLKLLDTAWKLNKKKIYYIMKTIAQTGIRVGELKYVTVEAIQVGITIVWNKEKYRNVYLTNKLCEELKIYCSGNNISEGPIFCGNKKGQTITNGAVWRSLKYIAIQAGIPQELVYPHSFRHLFAKEYMRKIGDISELADLLGHTRLETTWIYTKTTSEEKRVRLEHLDL